MEYIERLRFKVACSLIHVVKTREFPSFKTLDDSMGDKGEWLLVLVEREFHPATIITRQNNENMNIASPQLFCMTGPEPA